MDLLLNIVVILSLATVVVLASHKLKIPSIVGFLLTGVLAGPAGFGLLETTQNVQHLAEIGVVFLLFSIGLEFSLSTLGRLRRSALLGGGLQVTLTITMVALLAHLIGDQAPGESIALGFVIALSSTAIVLNYFQSHAQMEAPHARSALAMLIFQDVAAVLMILAIPFLAGGSQQGFSDIAIRLVWGVGIIAVVLLLAQKAAPAILHQVVRVRSRELFLFSVLTMCLGVAWLSYWLGLSVALGAFLAGLIISESDYSHEALDDILPFKDIFLSFFFISIGMLLDVRFLTDNLLLVSLLAVGVILGKSVVAAGVLLLLGSPVRQAMLSGLALGQIGEFSFVVAQAARGSGVIGAQDYQFILAVSVLTMAATPFSMAMAPSLVGRLQRNRFLQALRPRRRRPSPVPAPPALSGHLVVVGYGVAGRLICRAAAQHGLAYLVLETNPDTVRRERDAGVPIHYGDATRESVLTMAGVPRARVCIVVISDPTAVRDITAKVKAMNPACRLIVRSRFLGEMEPLSRLGADEVIPQEYESAVEIVSRLLHTLLAPHDEIERFINQLRQDHYAALRSVTSRGASVETLPLALPGIEVISLRLAPGAVLAGKTLREADLRTHFGVNVLAVQRGDMTRITPSPDDALEAGDIVVLMADHQAAARMQPLFAAPN